MLPREHRLCRTADIKRVYRAGRSWAHPLMVLHVLAQPSGRRLGVSVSKKVGSAVERNRVRRRIREAVRARIDHWKDGFDAVVSTRPAIAGASFAEIVGALDGLERRAGLAEPNRRGPEPSRGERPGPAERS